MMAAAERQLRSSSLARAQPPPRGSPITPVAVFSSFDTSFQLALRFHAAFAQLFLCFRLSP